MSGWISIRSVVIAGLLAMPCFAQPPSESADTVAKDFYAVYGTFHPSDGIPDAKARAKYEPLISPALDHLLAEGEAAEKRFSRLTKNMSPPLVEGDLFTSNFEGATFWSVWPCEIDGASAHCKVALGYRDGSKEDAKPVNWIDTLYLVRTTAGWRVDDVAYGAPWAFGNKGRLTETLRSAVRDSNDATP